jgi:hypothetical protein
MVERTVVVGDLSQCAVSALTRYLQRRKRLRANAS